MAYAEASDVAAELGRPDFTDEVQIRQIEAWIARVEGLIAARIPDLADRISAGDLSAGLVANVVAAVVAVKVRNPEGDRQVTVAVDDGSVTRMRSERDAGDLMLSDAQWELLAPPSTAFTIRPVGTGPDAFYTNRWPLRRH